MTNSNCGRIGIGSDIHRLSLRSKKPLVLGGVTIPSRRGIIAHSDGDALVHALIDALFGAAALGDIGQHFPDADPAWKDADSLELLRECCRMVAGSGYVVVNADTIVSLQSPRLSPYREEMRRSLASCLEMPPESISVKCKSGEKIGSVGRKKAVECRAAVFLVPG